MFTKSLTTTKWEKRSRAVLEANRRAKEEACNLLEGIPGFPKIDVRYIQRMPVMKKCLISPGVTGARLDANYEDPNTEVLYGEFEAGSRLSSHEYTCDGSLVVLDGDIRGVLGKKDFPAGTVFDIEATKASRIILMLSK